MPVALQTYKRLVVLGAPGSGKTTLLAYLALTYARDQRDGTTWVKDRLGLGEREGLPVLLPLRDLARHLSDARGVDGPRLLLDYLREYYRNQQLPLPADFFEASLAAGKAVLLFDGMDEVADPQTRIRVARLIEKFTLAYPQNRYVVTSRVVGYNGAARLGEGYFVTTVRDFTLRDVEQFVRYWMRAVEVALAGADTPTAQQAAARSADRLLATIQDNPAVRDLAVNPLLLTVIALLHRENVRLPDRRSELYEEAIRMLLGGWDEAKGLSATTLMAGRALDAGDRRMLLEPIALWMHERQAREIERADLRERLLPQFKRLVGDALEARKATDNFLQLINERSGLLRERGQGVYDFSHLTFQEHLAARAIADRDDCVAYLLKRLNDSWWREAILLTAGVLGLNSRTRTTRLIQAIMDAPSPAAEPFHTLVLAAEALRDVGLARVEGNLDQVIRARVKREIDEAQKAAQGSSGSRLSEPAKERRRQAVLAYLKIESGQFGGAPRFWQEPHGEPIWCDVSAGEFWMGTEGESYLNAKPVHRVFVPTFQIAQTPITNAQYAKFIEAKGYNDETLWTKSGWAWRKNSKRRQPPYWDAKHWNGTTQPLVGVTWFEAVAYCNWLSRVTCKTIRLPSEAEWEKAARGALDRREYPWGDDWREFHANTDELGLEGTTPVGLFLNGASPCGALTWPAMCGNGRAAFR